jgi:hypothetical protein
VYQEPKPGVLMSKKWIKSRTLWFNVITGALAIVNELQGKVIPTDVSLIVITLGNLILRVLTTKPLSK